MTRYPEWSGQLFCRWFVRLVRAGGVFAGLYMFYCLVVFRGGGNLVGAGGAGASWISIACMLMLVPWGRVKNETAWWVLYLLLLSTIVMSPFLWKWASVVVIRLLASCFLSMEPWWYVCSFILLFQPVAIICLKYHVPERLNDGSPDHVKTSKVWESGPALLNKLTSDGVPDADKKPK